MIIHSNPLETTIHIKMRMSKHLVIKLILSESDATSVILVSVSSNVHLFLGDRLCTASEIIRLF